MLFLVALVMASSNASDQIRNATTALQMKSLKRKMLVRADQLA